VSTLIIAQNILSISAGPIEAYRDSFFHVSSILTSTGYRTVDLNQWSLFARMILMILMFIGASAGSTAAGIKVVRLVIMMKGARQELKRFLHPNRVFPLTLDGKKMPESLIRGTGAYLFVYTMMFLLCMTVLAARELNLLNAFTATLSSLNNIGMEIIGGVVDYAALSVFSKLFLCVIMIMGRLEIFPVLILLLPSTWREH